MIWLLLALACNGTEKNTDTEVENTDTESGDTEVVTDTEWTDTELGSDTDTETPTETDTESPTETDTEAETDTDGGSDIEGVYLVATSSGSFSGTLGSLLATYAEDLFLEISNHDSSAATFDLRLAGVDSSSGAQDTCVQTSDFTADHSSDPAFSTDEQTAWINYDGVPLEFQEASFGGQVDASGMSKVAFNGELDTRSMLPLIGGTAPSDACDLLASVGITCVACPDGTGDYCTNVSFTGANASTSSESIVAVAKPSP